MSRLPTPVLVLFLLLALSFATQFPAAAAADEEEDENWQVPVTVGKDGWMMYVNPRFGFIIPVPAGLLPAQPPYNGDGQRFASADGKVTLVAYGAFNVEGNGDLEKRYQEDLAEPDRTITYKRKTEKWYVLSGVTKDGTGFYQRYTADKNHVAGWIIRYPQAQEKAYSPWVERIAKGYDARLGQGEDRVE